MRHACVIAAALLLGGCSLLQLFRSEPSPSPEWHGAQAAIAARSSIEEVAAYLSRLQAMSESNLAAEVKRLKAKPPADDAARLRTALAVMLAQPADDAEVLGLVEPVAKRDGGDPQVRAMASFLQAMVSDRRRLRESAAAANAKLRDERRVQESTKTRAEAAEQRAAQMQERAAQLQQKLDALTELEKSLSEKPISSR